MKTLRVALYLRVSTQAHGQTTDNQLLDLQEVAARTQSPQWVITHTFSDHLSGSSSKRPGFEALRQAAHRREFDLVAAWSVDRLGRSLTDLIHFLQDLDTLGIGLYLHKQSLDTTTPTGRLLFQLLSVFAEFERQIIRERVNTGIARARAQGKKLGRPGITQAKKERVLLDLAQPNRPSLQSIAAAHRISKGSVAALAKELRTSQE